MSDDYAARQAERDRRYREAWDGPEARQWRGSLPLEERRRLEAEGLLAPLLNRAGSTTREEDAAEMGEASVEAPHVSGSDSLEAILADYPHLEAVIEERARKMNGGGCGGETLRKLALLFIDQKRRALNADCLAFVSGLSFRMGESGTSLAKKHGISRQAFHKRCGDLLKELGLPPSRAMKSRKACDSYRASNRRWSVARMVNHTTGPH